MVDGFVIQVVFGNHGFHHLLLQAAAHRLQADVLVVLYRHHDGVDAQRHRGAAILLVLDSHLSAKKIQQRFVRTT